MSEQRKVPKLRFPEFTEDWEQRKFVKTFDFLPNNSLSRAQLTYENGTVKNVHYGDVLIKFGELLDVGKEELPYLIDDSLIKNYSSAVLKNGDVVIADAAEDETVGKCSEIKGIKDEKILSGLHTIPVRPRFEFENGYLGYFMNSHSYHDQLLPLIQGTKVSSISKKVLENTVISYPASSSEQEKIATFFENLTNLITLHQRKCDVLKKLKKGLLQKMFPKDGTNIPEIRFPEFTDAWEQRKLGDTVQITMGQSPDGSTYSDVPSDYILVQGNADLHNGWVFPRVWTSQMTKKADVGDLIMSVRAPAGAMGKTAYNAVIGRGVAAIKGNEFIYQLLVKMNSNGYWKALSCGSTFESLNSDSIKNADVLIPEVAEQEKIGEYFANLDHIITLHQRKLEVLKKLKKGLLQQMFV